MLTENETIFKQVPNHPGYEAGTDGSVWSYWRRSGPRGGYVLSEPRRRLRGNARPNDGRIAYRLKRSDRPGLRREYGGTIILETFVGARPEGMECCHNDGNCTNDALSNVRWDTPVNNNKDKVQHGTNLAGERHPLAKLTEKDVLEIRRIGYPLPPLAKQFNVSQSTISAILLRHIWKDV